jgi:hypothetical protein
MLSVAHAQDQIAQRGPRFAVVGTIRKDEVRLVLAPSAELAEKAAQSMREDNLRNVRLHLPQSDVDYARIGRELTEARARVTELLALARAAALRAVEAGLSEVETGHQLGVDRMTVRSWLGKR